MCLKVGLGVVLGSVFDDIGLGIALDAGCGMSLGIAIGAAFDHH
ncbi:glycine zipper family protein [candidate division KSB1 bacterium]|nr:glycine zipper family protein [candidate division KSB1 bacterium]